MAGKSNRGRRPRGGDQADPVQVNEIPAEPGSEQEAQNDPSTPVPGNRGAESSEPVAAGAVIQDPAVKKVQEALKKLRKMRRAMPGIGISARQHRRGDLVALYQKIVLAESPDIDEVSAQRLAQARANLDIEAYACLEQKYQEIEPYFGDDDDKLESGDPRTKHREVLVHALLQLPEMQYLKRLLERRKVLRRSRKEGRKAGDKRIVASFLWMALGNQPPIAERAHASFCGNAFRAWALGYPGDGPESSAWVRTLRARLLQTPIDILNHTNVELVRQLTELKDDAGSLLYPDAMRELVADGWLIEADIAQRPSLDDKDAERRHGKRYPNADYVVYKGNRSFEQDQAPEGYVDMSSRDVEEFEILAAIEEAREAAASERPYARHKRQVEKLKRECLGYKVVTLSALRLKSFVLAGIFPATVDERKAVLALLKELFELWPDARVHALVGDSLYDVRSFCEELVFRWRIQPVFTRHGTRYGKEWEYTDPTHADKMKRGINGVPCCDHGLMEVRGPGGSWLDAQRAHELGIPRGVWAAGHKRFCIRWKCPRGICKTRRTYPHKNARIYTWYPRIELGTLMETFPKKAKDGEKQDKETTRDALAAERVVLSAFRNTVESLYSMLQSDYLGGSNLLRARWADENDLKWLIKTAILGLTARRLAWAKGLYDASWDEALTLGMTRVPSRENPSAGPTKEELDEAEAAKVPLLPRPPRTWSDGEHYMPEIAEIAAA